jgi:Extensin-like protein C-terminus
VGGFVNPVAVLAPANGKTCPVFHPAIAIRAAFIIAIVVGASAQPAISPKQEAAAASACQVRLSSDRAVFKSIGDIGGDSNSLAECGARDAVLLQRIVLPDHTEVAVEPPAKVRCEMAEAITDFVREDLAPAAAVLGSPLSAIENHDSYDCRGRNRIIGAKLSEHGHANALDVRSIRLKDGRIIRPADAGASLAFRMAMKASVCNRFTTVLGPGSDGYHEDHIHMDRAERRASGYRMCRWELRDEPRFALQSVSTQPAERPRVAAAVSRGSIPLPRPRPFEAADARPVNLPAESLLDEAHQSRGP